MIGWFEPTDCQASEPSYTQGKDLWDPETVASHLGCKMGCEKNDFPRKMMQSWCIATQGTHWKCMKIGKTTVFVGGCFKMRNSPPNVLDFCIGNPTNLLWAAQNIWVNAPLWLTLWSCASNWSMLRHHGSLKCSWLLPTQSRWRQPR